VIESGWPFPSGFSPFAGTFMQLILSAQYLIMKSNHSKEVPPVSRQLTSQNQSPEETYSTIRGYVVNAQNRVAAAVNSAMVLAYHEIGEQIYKACGENDRAGYGKGLLQYLSERLTAEFGSGFQVRNLQMMRKFYLTFPNANALRSELSWTHYRLLMRVPDEAARQFFPGGVRQVGLEFPPAGAADPHHVLPADAGKPGQEIGSGGDPGHRAQAGV